MRVETNTGYSHKSTMRNKNHEELMEILYVR
jgi:hypothetical protein